MFPIIETLDAGEVVEVVASGRYFEIVDLTGGVDIRLTTREGREVASGRAVLVGTYYNTSEKFETITIANTGAAVVTLRAFYGDGQAGSRAVRGSVSIIDGAQPTVESSSNIFLLEDALTVVVGQQFQWQIRCLSGTIEIRELKLFMPSQVGRIRVGYVTTEQGTQSAVNARRYSDDPSPGVLDANVNSFSSNNLGGVPNVMEEVFNTAVLGDGGFRYKLPKPFVQSAGATRGKFCFSSDNVNAPAGALVFVRCLYRRIA